MFISAYLTEFFSFKPQPYKFACMAEVWRRLSLFNVIKVAFTRFAICEQVHIALA